MFGHDSAHTDDQNQHRVGRRSYWFIDLLDSPSVSQERDCRAFGLRLALKPECVTQRRAFDDFIRPLVVTRESHPHGEVGAGAATGFAS
jgi:hypothetical protein